MIIAGLNLQCKQFQCSLEDYGHCCWSGIYSYRHIFMKSVQKENLVKRFIVGINLLDKESIFESSVLLDLQVIYVLCSGELILLY